MLGRVFGVDAAITKTVFLLNEFRRSYRKNEVIEENKALLKEKYTAAKSLGKQVSLTSPRP